MLAGVLITIREGLEAFLITGILLGYLKKLDQSRLACWVWLGTLGGVASSIALALAFQVLAVHFDEEHGGALFELVAAALAVPILSYMVLWMQRRARTLKSEIETRAAAAISSGQVLALAFVAFITVFREGLETAVFLSALAARASGDGLLLGALLGLLAAIAIAYAYFALTVTLDLRKFFVATGVFLIFIAAGLCAHVFMALHELGAPVLIERVWSTKWLIDSESLGGRLLHAFIGYHDEPNLFEVVAYFGYVTGMGAAFFRAVRWSPPRSRASTSRQPGIAAGV